jgi:hypothetical protein
MPQWFRLDGGGSMSEAMSGVMSDAMEVVAREWRLNEWHR